MINLFKFQYNDTRNGNSWSAYILAEERTDAEFLLKTKVNFPFSISYAEHLGRVDAISDKVLDQILNINKNKVINFIKQIKEIDVNEDKKRNVKRIENNKKKQKS